MNDAHISRLKMFACCFVELCMHIAFGKCLLVALLNYAFMSLLAECLFVVLLNDAPYYERLRFALIIISMCVAIAGCRLPSSACA